MRMKKYTIYDFENRTTKFICPVMIFISQPFTGYSKEKIIKIRKEAEQKIREKYKDDTYIKFLDTLTSLEYDDPIEGLSHAILYLSLADAAYFVKLYDVIKDEYLPMSRGMRIEYAVCKEYNISTSEVHICVGGDSND